MTLPEVLLWKQLKGKQLLGYDFDRQRPIDIYIVDVYCKELNLAIEVDGSDHDYEKDRARQERLEAMGVKFLRFSNREVPYEMDFVLASIVSWIQEHGSERPTPPHLPSP